MRDSVKHTCSFPRFYFHGHCFHGRFWGCRSDTSQGVCSPLTCSSCHSPFVHCLYWQSLNSCNTNIYNQHLMSTRTQSQCYLYLSGRLSRDRFITWWCPSRSCTLWSRVRRSSSSAGSSWSTVQSLDSLCQVDPQQWYWALDPVINDNPIRLS